MYCFLFNVNYYPLFFTSLPFKDVHGYVTKGFCLIDIFDDFFLRIVVVKMGTMHRALLWV